MFDKAMRTVLVCGIFLLGGTAVAPAADDLRKQVDEIRGVLPKFAAPMREVGGRFQDMYFAAKGGNWGLAAYMAKYMDKAVNPASVTKPEAYEIWKTFFEETCKPLNRAIAARDFKAFDKEYVKLLDACNDCHAAMGYGFIKVVKPEKPSSGNLDFSVKSQAADLPK